MSQTTICDQRRSFIFLLQGRLRGIAFLSDSVAVSKECLADHTVLNRDEIKMKFNRFNQCVFCRQAFRWHYQSVCKRYATCLVSRLKNNSGYAVGYRPITEIVRLFTEIFENREILPKCLKTPQNRETL